jgi:hypothetical protein
MFPRCSAHLYESVYGLPVHTNCHDIQSEAQREYGLTPDDVHDSFNFFMATGVKEGMPYITRQSSRPGDHVELLALIDVLAVPNVCGADIMKTSNFSIKPVKVAIYEAAPGDLEKVPALPARLPSQRTPADFRQARIKADREFTRDPAYVAEFVNTPVVYEDFAVELDEEEYAAFQRLARTDLYGADEGAALRDIVFSWWEQRFIGAAP